MSCALPCPARFVASTADHIALFPEFPIPTMKTNTTALLLAVIAGVFFVGLLAYFMLVVAR